jgi:hypothetical protein
MIIIGIQSVISQKSISKKGTMNIGFETGIQFTGISDPNSQYSDNGIGYATGVFFDYYITNLIKLRGGLYYDSRAFSLGEFDYIYDTNLIYRSTSYYNVLRDYKVNYLTIPISLIYIKGTDKFKLFIQGTLYFSLYLNSNQKGDFHIYISEEDAPYFDIEDYPEYNIPGDHYFEVEDEIFSTSDIGINLLFGAVYYIKPNLGITLSPGLSYSFANVWEDPLRKTTWTNIYKINIGITYTLNKK